ncbi:MAG: hypothetical protein WB014_13860 [Methanosarcina sp.]
MQNGVKNLFLNLTKWDIYDYCAFLERKGYELNGKRREYAEASIFAYKASIKNLLRNINPEAVDNLELSYRKDELLNRVIKNVKFDDYCSLKSSKLKRVAIYKKTLVFNSKNHKSSVTFRKLQ